MAEKSPIKLDKKDKLIMHQLEKNSRASYTAIGKAVGLSGETVEYRIDRIVKAGIITRMFAEPNLTRLGLKTYRIYFKIERIGEKEEEELIDYFEKHPHGQWFAEFEGEWDYTMRFTLENESQFKDEIGKIMLKFGKYIKAKSIAITVYQTYLPVTYFVEGERKAIFSTSPKEEKIIEIDKKDKAILHLLFDNARMKTVDIGKKIGLSADAVKYRINNLTQKGVINFYTVWFDRRLLGYNYYKVLLWLQHTSKEDEEKLLQYAIQHPNIVFINRVLGDWDFELDFDAKDPQELHKMVKELRNHFAGLIRDHSTLTILRDKVLNPF